LTNFKIKKKRGNKMKVKYQ